MLCLFLSIYKRISMYMTKKKRMKKAYKKGFNLIETYPVKFSETIVFVKHNGPVDNFSFSFPDKKVDHIIVNLCPTEPWALPNLAILRNRTHDFLNKLVAVRAEHFPDSHCHVVVSHQDTTLVNEFNQYKANAIYIVVLKLISNVLFTTIGIWTLYYNVYNFTINWIGCYKYPFVIAKRVKRHFWHF